jgi:hypothetical protein
MNVAANIVVYKKVISGFKKLVESIYKSNKKYCG